MIAVVLIFFQLFAFAQKSCEYSYTIWNTRSNKSEGPIRVKKSYQDLTAVEKGPEGCTVCEADQTQVTLSNGIGFLTCRRFAGQFQATLNKVLQSGRKIESVVSYRPSISKGPVDSRGLRTQFSHHAFGSAIDINENANGLYANCLQWNPGCRLIKGGAYRPSEPLAIRDKDEFVTHFKGIGFEWGGKIHGNQKDFMHFSLDGY